jgi:hypothetical protein
MSPFCACGSHARPEYRGFQAKKGWEFGWDALHDLKDRSIDDAEVAAIRGTLEP